MRARRQGPGHDPTAHASWSDPRGETLLRGKSADFRFSRKKSGGAPLAAVVLMRQLLRLAVPLILAACSQAFAETNLTATVDSVLVIEADAGDAGDPDLRFYAKAERAAPGDYWVSGSETKPTADLLASLSERAPTHVDARDPFVSFYAEAPPSVRHYYFVIVRKSVEGEAPTELKLTVALADNSPGCAGNLSDAPDPPAATASEMDQ